MKFTTTVEADLTVEQLAALFADLDDDEQARFFVAAASHDGMQNQAWEIGQHLKTCKCSTNEAREFVRGIVGSLDYKEATCPEHGRILPCCYGARP